MSGLTKAAGLPSEASVLALGSLASPPVFTDIANMGDITCSASRAVVDVSSHGGNGVRRKISTLLDPGDYTTTLWFIPGANLEPTHTDHTNGIQAIWERGDLRQFRFSYGDSLATATFFNAYVTKFAKKATVAGVLSADVTFTIDNAEKTGTVSGGPSTAVFAPSE